MPNGGDIFVFGPQSMILLILLVAGFAGLAYVLARPGMLVLRIGAGVLSFAVAAVFGTASVNRYYDYYQTWGDLFNDLSGRQPGVVALPPEGGKQLTAGGDRVKNGLLVDTQLGGAQSAITRNGLVYLPPQYFQPKYTNVNFPVLELLHGSPGHPSDWQTGLHLTETYQRLMAKHQAKPVILVIPDINGTSHGNIGSQCLNLPGGGAQSDTYLSQDVPADVTRRFRADPVGPHWGIAGFSEGGFCAVNLALRHPRSYKVAGSMSGYFQPLPERGIDPFQGDAKLRLANDPVWLASKVTPLDQIPSFWLMAGTSDRGDLQSARAFQSVLNRHSPTPLVTIPRARHSFAAWNPALPKLLTWATTRL
jgi:hypothetical protein